MSKLVTVRIAHQLGKGEALRRLQSGIGQARTTFPATITSIEEDWRGDHLAFRVSALGQVVAGTLDVSETHVDAAFELPTALAFFAERIKARLEKQGVLMLEHK